MCIYIYTPISPEHICKGAVLHIHAHAAQRGERGLPNDVVAVDRETQQRVEGLRGTRARVKTRQYKGNKYKNIYNK